MGFYFKGLERSQTIIIMQRQSEWLSTLIHRIHKQFFDTNLKFPHLNSIFKHFKRDRSASAHCLIEKGNRKVSLTLLD